MFNSEKVLQQLDLGLDDHVKIENMFKLFTTKHPEIYKHCVRVSMLAEKIADTLDLKSTEKEQLIRGCFLHDIGKLMIPREIILERGPLTERQWEVIRLHPILGEELLSVGLRFSSGITGVVRSHHERWDGKGYPDGLKGTEIPLYARICAVLDAFDSMTSNSTYRRSLNISEAKLELLRHAGTQFDPNVVHGLMKLTNEILDIYSLT